MSRVLRVNTKKCTGCRYCEMVCSLQHEGVINSQKSRIRIVKWNIREDQPVFCRQGQDCSFECMESCPVSAISVAGHVVVVDETVCIGCGMCAKVCPHQAIWVLGEKAYKCDLCGGEPECVKFCTIGALQVSEI